MARLLTTTLAAAALMLAGPAAANDCKQAMAPCAAIEDDTTRLACFDAFFLGLGVRSESEVESEVESESESESESETEPEAESESEFEPRARFEGSGKWESHIETNPLDDTTAVALSLVADEGETGLFGDPVYMVLRCRSGELEHYVEWRTLLGFDAAVTSRVGDADATTSDWELSTSGSATFYPHGGDAIERHVLALAASDRYVAKVTPFSDNPVTAVFDTRGLANVIPPLLEACSVEP